MAEDTTCSILVTISQQQSTASVWLYRILLSAPLKRCQLPYSAQTRNGLALGIHLFRLVRTGSLSFFFMPSFHIKQAIRNFERFSALFWISKVDYRYR